MRKNIKDFFKRGLLEAWGGPVILAIVCAVWKDAGGVEMLTGDEVDLGIISNKMSS